MLLEASADLVFSRLSAADEAVSRLDEQVAACPWRVGFAARRDFAEAIAWSWTQGEVTRLEDLVLHDEGMDLHLPNAGLRAAHGVVAARRKAVIGGPSLLDLDGLSWLAGQRAEPPAAAGGSVTRPRPLLREDPDRPGMTERLERMLRGLEDGEAASARKGMAEWLDVAAGLDTDIPALLRAAGLLEAWWIIDPLPRQRYLGAIAVGLWLQRERRVVSHLLGLEAGLRNIQRRGRELRGGSVMRRLAYWLLVMKEAADEGQAELKRLALARQVMARQVAGRRAHARAGEVMELLMASPVVTAPMIAARLGVTQQSARRSLEELGSVVAEISGRSRFRAWRV